MTLLLWLWPLPPSTKSSGLYSSAFPQSCLSPPGGAAGSLRLGLHLIVDTPPRNPSPRTGPLTLPSSHQATGPAALLPFGFAEIASLSWGGGHRANTCASPSAGRLREIEESGRGTGRAGLSTSVSVQNPRWPTGRTGAQQLTKCSEP